MYPDLLANSVDREASDFDLDYQREGEVLSWNVSFHRDFHDWEVESLNSFLNHIYSKVPKGEGVIG